MNKLFKISLIIGSILLPSVGYSQSAEQSEPGFGTFGTNCKGTGSPCHVPLGATPMAAVSQYNLAVASATTLTVPSGANGAFVTAVNEGAFTANVNFTLDGSTPTSTIGHEIQAGSTVYFARPYLSVVQFIQTAASGAVTVTYVQ